MQRQALGLRGKQKFGCFRVVGLTYLVPGRGGGGEFEMLITPEVILQSPMRAFVVGGPSYKSVFLFRVIASAFSLGRVAHLKLTSNIWHICTVD